MTLAEILLGAGLAIVIVSSAAIHLVIVGLIAIPGFVAALALLVAAGMRLGIERPPDRPVAAGATIYVMATACLVVSCMMGGMMGYRIAISGQRPAFPVETPAVEWIAVVVLAVAAAGCLYGSLAKLGEMTTARRAGWGIALALAPVISLVLVVVLAILFPISA